MSDLNEKYIQRRKSTGDYISRVYLGRTGSKFRYLGAYKSLDEAVRIRDAWIKIHAENPLLGFDIIDKMCGVKKGIRGGCKKCKRCGGTIKTDRVRAGALYCSWTCSSRESIDKRKQESGGDTPTSRGNTGVMSELYVCADIIKRGFYVFRSMNINNPVDLVLQHNGRFYGVEVKTGRSYTNGNGSKNTAHPQPKNEYYDILAVYNVSEDTILYQSRHEITAEAKQAEAEIKFIMDKLNKL
jgi:hypothetical protein